VVPIVVESVLKEERDMFDRLPIDVESVEKLNCIIVERVEKLFCIIVERVE